MTLFSSTATCTVSTAPLWLRAVPDEGEKGERLRWYGAGV